MDINSNILVITDENSTLEFMKDDELLLRFSDVVSCLTFTDLKKYLKSISTKIILLDSVASQEEILKQIKLIKAQNNNHQIILMLHQENEDLLLQAYDLGIYDYFYIDSSKTEIIIKILNSLKFLNIMQDNSLSQNLMVNLGIKEDKYCFYNYRFLDNVYEILQNNPDYYDSYLILMTIEDSVKTKISTNRLAQLISSNKRTTDIVARNSKGMFYILLPNIDFENVKNVIDKYQQLMGEDFPLRCGVCSVKNRSFEQVNELLNNSLNSAIQNDLISDCIEQRQFVISEDNQQDKTYKLFEKTLDKKYQNIIQPLFYRYSKMFEEKFKKEQVLQFTSKSESSLTIKGNDIVSQIKLTLLNQTKYKLEITHSGIFSSENTVEEIKMLDITEGYLNNMFNKLKTEYSSAKKGNN